MERKLYKNYVDDIANYLKQTKSSDLQKGYSYSNLNESSISKSELNWLSKTKNEADFRSLSPLSSFTGHDVKFEEKLGAHPSFQNLKITNTSEYHYIVSMFIDVKNSTGLFKKYEPVMVANICRTIQLAAIHTCWYFDGYIQRLQGDGLMVYFGGKGISKQSAVESALMASSFINYFMKNDLRNLFDEQGVSRIYTRIGIDFGDEHSTLWHNAGIGECSEVTTTSLHTSLACKMQAQADSNGVVVGQNILPFKIKDSVCFEHKKYNTGSEEKEYVYESISYKQYAFDWERYLKNHPLIDEDVDGNLTFKGKSILAPSNIEPNIQNLQDNAANYKPYLK